MSDLEIVASLENMFQKWIDENLDDMDVGWCGDNLSRHLAIAAAQSLWIQRESSRMAEE